mgnify:FL=1
MARPPRAESSADKRINIRLSPKEWAKLQESLPHNVSAPEFVRAAALGHKLHVRRGPSRESRDIAHTLGRLGNNLNQIARGMNEARRQGALEIDVATAADIERSVDEVREKLDALGTSLLSEGGNER